MPLVAGPAREESGAGACSGALETPQDSLSRRSFSKVSAPMAQAWPMGCSRLASPRAIPTAHSVVLWTRLAPDPLNGGGMGNTTVPVRWEVALDADFLQRRRNAYQVYSETMPLRPENRLNEKKMRLYQARVRNSRRHLPPGYAAVPLRPAGRGRLRVDRSRQRTHRGGVRGFCSRSQYGGWRVLPGPGRGMCETLTQEGSHGTE